VAEQTSPNAVLGDSLRLFVSGVSTASASCSAILQATTAAEL
jgi:hypothetical protein